MKNEGAIPKKGFRITVEGKYIVAETIGHNKVCSRKDYKITVNVPEYNGTETLSLIKNRLLEPALRRFDPAAKSFLTHSITGVEPLGEETGEGLAKVLTVRTMSVPQLVNFVKGQKLPLYLPLYVNDIESFRTNIEACQKDQKAFLVKQQELREDWEIQQELKAMNPEIEPTGKVQTVTITPAKPVLTATAVVENQELVAEAQRKEAEKAEAAKGVEAVDPDPDSGEGYLTDGAETFNRDSEAPFADDVDEEVVASDKELEVEADKIIAENDAAEEGEGVVEGSTEETDQLINDL